MNTSFQKYQKYKMLYKNLKGGTTIDDSKIQCLLTADMHNDICNIHPKILDLKIILQKYISVPWNCTKNALMLRNEYIESIMKMNTPLNCENILSCKDCTTRVNDKTYCQSHGGDLFAHSQWTALQIILWFNENNEIIRGLNIDTAIICAFFHDIGKGQDCIFNMYSSDKYDKRSDSVHPEYCGDVILGKKNIRKCKSSDSALDEYININNLLKTEFPNININIVAITAYMHWEFGKLNIGKDEDLHVRLNTYMQTLYKNCNENNILFNMDILKYCIAISCADITASTNKRLIHHLNIHEFDKNDNNTTYDFLNVNPDISGLYESKFKNITVAPQVYASYNPWESFNMVNKYKVYSDKLIKTFFNFKSYLDVIKDN